LAPAATELGEAEFVTTRSACVAVATTSFAVALLFARFGSAPVELTLTVSLIAVPGVAAPLTVTTNVMVAGEPAAKPRFVHVRVPTLQVHPGGPLNDTAAVFAGRASLNVTLAVLGPAFVTTCV
jgi:hypothetical protein